MGIATSTEPAATSLPRSHNIRGVSIKPYCTAGRKFLRPVVRIGRPFNMADVSIRRPEITALWIEYFHGINVASLILFHASEWRGR